MESALNLSSLLKLYFGDEKILSVAKALEEKKSSISLKGLAGSSISFIIRAVAEKKSGVHLIVLQDKEQAAYVLNDLETLTSPQSPLPVRQAGLLSVRSPSDKERGAKLEVLFFPSSFKKPFITEEQDTSSIQLRAEVLNSIRQADSGNTSIIISYPEAIAEKVISKEHLEKNSIDIIKGEKISLQFLTELLNEYGFERCNYVLEPGQFSIRGGIVDIFSFSNDAPFRIELSGDEIESIRTFDTANQLSLQNFERASILPNIQEKMLEVMSSSIIEYIIDNQHDNINVLTLWINDINHAANTIEHGLKIINESSNAESNNATSEVFINADELTTSIAKINTIDFGKTSPLSLGRGAGPIRKDSFGKDSYGGGEAAFNFSPQPDFNKNFNLLEQDLRKNTQKQFQNFIFCDSEKQSERLYAIFESLSAKDGKQDKAIQFTPLLHTLHEGFTDQDKKISCYTDHQIFGRYHRYKLKSNSFKKNEALTIKMLKSLQPGDYITHIDYGIGRFGGLEKILLPSPPGEGSGVRREQEAIRLVFKDNDTLHISIHSLHQISKHTGKDGEAPKLDKLGSNAWDNLKKRTKKKVKEIAFDLIKLYAERKTKKGFAFSPDNYLQNELEASFIYEDTPDQMKTTADVKRDMEEDFPMDRLVCGDVGFGKTEIAVRAAFKAACDSKQVAILVPTTILALQHFKTFSERMKGLPCTIDYINRFCSSKEQKETLQKLAEGKVDIIIGTHRLISKDVKFKDLGLLIVDEEQKFGVGTKDKLKTFKANVDTLTLTATPIPRTLQFSMMGARDLSVINTAPPNRYPVHTEVQQFNEKIICDAVEYEIARGGQIFFVHNRVQSIGKFAGIIQKLCPKARILIAHGQLKGEALEKAMVGFIDGEYDILICTTIIESGLDIANANTIIINDAQNYGLSDLYQLRGRVGRSNKKAFCYLLTPPFSSLTNEAKKRLRAIEEFSDLGSGFNIAMRDLDIRGAGNLLGAEQSGFITDIGYEMYQKILDEAMGELREELADLSPIPSPKGEGRKDEAKNFVRDCTIETDLEVLIPDEYVENITERVGLYQQLDNSKTEDDLSTFEKQLIDRFGPVPEQTKQLINIVRLRWLAMKLGFEKLVLKNKRMNGWFITNKNSPFYQSETFSKILSFVQNNPKICQMKQGEEKLSLLIENIKNIDAAIELLKKIIN